MVLHMTPRLSRLVAAAMWLLFFCDASTALGQTRDQFAAARRRMVTDVIEAEGVTNKLVLDAMATVPRHEFVSGLLRARAYEDVALPIGAQQTISSPFIVAYMTETINPKPTDRVLEIGTGSGYQAAVLSTIVDEVYSIEIVETLAKSAKKRLAKLGFDNVTSKHGDGYLGWEEHAPFDRIIVTCSPESVPQPLIDQLKEGGTMVIPIGERYQQSFYLLTKKDGKLEEEKLVPTLFVPMTGASEELRRIQPDADNPRIVNGDFEFDENEDGRADGWHYQRKTEMSPEEPMHGEVCLRFSNDNPGELSQALQGCGVNGRKIGLLNFSIWARTDAVVPGTTPHDVAGAYIHFYDSVRREVGHTVLVRWRGTGNWQQTRRAIPVPANAREMVIRIGLNGSTGTLDVDAFQIAPVRR